MTRHPSDRRRYSIDRRAALQLAIDTLREYNDAFGMRCDAADLIEHSRDTNYLLYSRRDTSIIRRAEDRPAPEPEPKKESAPDEVPFVSLNLSDIFGAIKDACINPAQKTPYEQIKEVFERDIVDARRHLMHGNNRLVCDILENLRKQIFTKFVER